MMRMFDRNAKSRIGHPHSITTSHTSILKNLKRARSQSTDTILLAEYDQETDHARSRKKRKKFEYQGNHTAALAFPLTNEELEFEMTDALTLLDKAREYIKEHASRRVELFFYTLIAYYKTGYVPNRGHTFLQYGRGRNSQRGESITQACHSSFFGAFVDDSPVSTVPVNYNEDQHSILSGTHFLHSLNATIELPGFVNKLDDELENACLCRVSGLIILRQVSLGQINPIEGMKKFFIMMQKVFNEMENSVATDNNIPFLLKDSADSPQCIKKELIEITKYGTFEKKWNNDHQAVENNFIDLILRLRPEEKNICTRRDKEGMNLYEKKMQEMQMEILRVEENLNLNKIVF